MAAALWWRPAWRWRWQLGGSAILAVAAVRLEMLQQRGGGGGNNGALAAAAWRSMLIIILIITMTMIINRGREKREKDLKDGFVFFMLSYFVIALWLIFFNAGQLISAIVAACCCYHCGEKKVSQ